LLLVNYLHFDVEHRRGHHVRVGTHADPATARWGEGFWAFLVRTVPGQFASAVELERERLAKRRQSGPHLNFVWRAVALQVAVAAGLFWLLGGAALGAYLVQSLVAVVLLEFVNYIEHYGLLRAEGERVGPHHAWQSDTLSSRFMLFELSRHADHHAHTVKPYHTLVSHAEGYQLPSGYFGVFYLGMIPPLWFRVIHPIIERHQARRGAGVAVD
ncbi:MAG: fatty acid desaturase, partial [Catalinimonas sp.]